MKKTLKATADARDCSMRKLRLVEKPQRGKAKRTRPLKQELLSLKFQYENTFNKKERLYKQMDTMLAFCPATDEPEWWGKFNAVEADWKAAIAELKTLEAAILQKWKEAQP